MSERSRARIAEDTSGTVTEPSLHDGHITSIAVEDATVARIGIVSREGSRVDLYLEGLKKLRADGFAEGNTILDITVWEFAQSDAQYLPALYFSDGHDPSEFSRIAFRAIRERWKLVMINESYGCRLLALCDLVTYRVV